VTAAPARRETLPKASRLRRRQEFVRVQNQGEKHHVRHFLVFVLEHAGADDPGAVRLPPARLGVTVTRKVGPAVRRNRIRRWVREAFRRVRTRFAPGTQMVWVAKQTAAAGCYAEVVADMNTILGRLARGGTRT
jgi:ribonuclease P protein component